MNDLPAWWSGKADKQKQNRRAAKQEREHAQRQGGRVQPGSGSSRTHRQDVKVQHEDGEGFLDECKGTRAGRFPIELGYWLNLERHALDIGKEPRLFIEFRDVDDRVVKRLRVTEDDPDL